MPRRPLRSSLSAMGALAGALLIFAAGAGVGGCAHPPPAVRPGPAPTAARLLEILDARHAALTSMNARARATSWIGGDRIRATVLMLVARGGRLRFEAEISLQGTVSILTTDEERFQLLDLRGNQLQLGPACPANVASLVRIPLAPAEVAAILLGDVQLPSSSSLLADASVDWDAARGADVLIIKRGGLETRVFFRVGAEAAGRGAEILGAAAAGPDGPHWRTSYEELENAAGGLRLPAVIRFAERASSFDDGVEIRFKDRTANAEAPPGSFTIKPPAGTRVIDVGCGQKGGGGDGDAPAGAVP